MKEKLRKFRKSRIASLLLILLFIAGCMGLGAGLAYIEHESDPTDVATQYFRAFVQQDYDKMYQLLTKKDGYYIDKKMYTDNMKKMHQEYIINSYEILEPSKEGDLHTVSIKCVDTSTKETRNFVVYLDNYRKGKSIIPEYSVNIDKMMVKDFSVMIPKEKQLELNGEKITDKIADVSTDENDNLVYQFKGVLSGAYKVTATDKYSAMNNNIQLKESGEKIDMTKVSLTASEEYTKLIKESGDKVLDQFYKAVRDREPSRSKLLKCFENKKKLKEKVEKLVTESQEIVYWKETKNIDNYKVVDMNIKDLKNKLTYNAKTKVYTLKYTYEYNYVSSTDTALYTSYVYRLSGKCKCEMTLSYQLKGDDVVLTDITLKNKNEKDE